MTRVYDDAKDKNVATVVVYADASNNLFYDVEGTKAVPATDCLDLFFKGVIALKGTTYYAAKSCTAAGVIDFGFPA